MGVHARRAARRTTPLVAAAAGIGTVAAMLASPLPASAASYIADSTYGKTSATDPNLDRAARGGFTDTQGIDAVTLSTDDRVVLGQRVGGSDARPVRLARFDTSGNLVTQGFGTNGIVTLIGGSGTGGNSDIPASFNATKLLYDANLGELYIVGNARATIVVIRLFTDGTIDTNYGQNGVAKITDSANLPDATWGASTSVASAALDFGPTNNANAAKVVLAVQAASSGGARSNRVLQLDSTGAPDVTFGNHGYAALPGAVTGAVSLGGLTVFSSGKIAGTAQAFGSTADSQSVVYQLTGLGAADHAFLGSGSVDGQSMDLETKFDSQAYQWSNESLGDLVEVPNSANGSGDVDFIISGRAGNKLFLAKVDSNGTVDPNWNDTGISDAISSSCATGMPRFAGYITSGGVQRLWLANDCGSTGEIMRWRTGGYADLDFGSSGMVRVNGNDYGFNGSVTAEPITADSNGNVVIGAGTVSTVVSQPQYDLAGWRIVALDPAAIITQPDSQSVTAVTGHADFNVTVTGSPTPSIQWQAAAPGSDNWWDLSNGQGVTGVDTTHLRIGGPVASQNGTRYRARVANGGAPLFSAPATLSITGTPAITSQPANQSVAIGSHSASFTAWYLGDAPVTSMWEMKSGDGAWMPATGGNISISSGSNSTTLAITQAMGTNNGMQFRVTLTNSLGRVMSLPAVLEVTGVPNHPEPVPGSSKPRGDYDGDGKTDVATFTPSNGAFTWNGGSPKMFGKAGDIPVVGNYDSDSAADMTVFRPSNGMWYVDGMEPMSWGKSGDKPVAGDFNGDGTSDIAVFRPSTGTWLIKGMDPIAFGRSTDIPVPGDYNGDGKTDPAVFRPSNGMWYVWGQTPVAFGRSTDWPLVGDWNGDGKTDMTVYRPSNGTWYTKGSDPVAFGRATDIPLSGDFNGDGKTDVAVFRPSNNTWYFWGGDPVQFGSNGDWPLPRG